MRGRTRFLLAVVCGSAVSSIYAAQPLLGEVGADLGMPESGVGWLVAVAQLGYLIGLFILTPLGDLLDRRRLIAVHLAVVSLGLLVVAVAPGMWVALAGFALTGAFAVVVQTAVAYAAALSSASERGRDLGVVTSGVVVGILGSRVVSGALADLAGWRAVFLVLAIVMAGLIWCVLRVLEGDRPKVASGYRQLLTGTLGLFGQPVFRSRGLIAFFLFASFGVLWSGMALPLAAAPWHMSEAQIGLFGLVGLAGALGAARAGRWADAGHVSRVTGLATLVLPVSWVALGQLTWSLPLLIVGVVLLDFAVQAAHVSNQHVLTSAYPDRVSATLGAYMVFYSLGSALGAAVTTTVQGAAGWVGSAVAGAIFALGAFLAWVHGRRREVGTRAPARRCST